MKLDGTLSIKNDHEGVISNIDIVDKSVVPFGVQDFKQPDSIYLSVSLITNLKTGEKTFGVLPFDPSAVFGIGYSTDTKYIKFSQTKLDGTPIQASQIDAYNILMVLCQSGADQENAHAYCLPY